MRPAILALFCVASAHFLENSLLSDTYTAHRHRRHDPPAPLPVPPALFMQEVNVTARLEFYSIARSSETRPKGEVRAGLRDWAERHGVADSYAQYVQQETDFMTKRKDAFRQVLILLHDILANDEEDLSRNMMQARESFDRSLNEASSDPLVREMLREVAHWLLLSDPTDEFMYGDIMKHEISDVMSNPPQPLFIQKVEASARRDYYRIAESYESNQTMRETRELLDKWAEANNVTDSLDEFLTSSQQFDATVRRMKKAVIHHLLPALWKELGRRPSPNRSLSQERLDYRTILDKYEVLTQQMYENLEETMARNLDKYRTQGNVFLEHWRISAQREEDAREERRRGEKDEEDRRDRKWLPDEQRRAGRAGRAIIVGVILVIVCLLSDHE